MTKGAMGSFDRFVREIHRRSLWQVLGIYLVGSWIALQVVDVLANNFGLPEWFPPFALALLVIGLPVVLATAFIQKGLLPHETTDAVSGEAAPALGDEAGHRRLFTWRNAIAGGVAAFGLWGVVATAWLLFGPGAGASATAGSEAGGLRSVAVLPLVNRSAQEGSEYFTDGMHDDILTQLSKIDGLKVISRTSVMSYRDTDKTLPEIASELGVATVLEGAVDRAGNRIRINVQLIDAATDEHLWGETYDEELTAANLFAIRTDLSKKIAAALRATLTPEVEERLASRPTESLEAYDLYSRGRYIYEGRGSPAKEDLEEAAELFRQATLADPFYALAYAALGNVYLSLWNRAYLPADEALPAARDAARRALELDPTLAEVHVARARVFESELRYDESERALQRALELNPGLAEAHRLYGRLLYRRNRHDEALPSVRRAVELDPLSVRNRQVLSDALWWARQWDASIAESRTVLEMQPQSAYAYYNLGYAYGMKGEHAEAIAALERSRELDPGDLYSTLGLAWAHARAGDSAKARALLAEVPERDAYLREIAIVYGELGELDRAFAFLDRAYEEDPGSLGSLPSDATADPLRADPRFGDLLDRLGLE